MAEETTPAENDTTEPVVVETTEPATVRSFNQDEVDKLIGKRVSQAETKAQRDLLESLGFESVAAAKQFRDDQAAAELAQMSEAERLQTEAKNAIADADAAKATAQTESLRAKMTSALLAGENGVNPARAEVATRFALEQAASSGLAGDEQIVDAVEHVRDELPEWFQASNGEIQSGVTTPPPPDRPGQQRKTSSTQTPADKAKEMHERFKAGRAKAPMSKAPTN